MESLILAQDERWRRASYMQVERESPFGGEYSGERVSNTWATCPEVGDNPSKGGLIPHDISDSSGTEIKASLCFMLVPPEGPAPH